MKIQLSDKLIEVIKKNDFNFMASTYEVLADLLKRIEEQEKKSKELDKRLKAIERRHVLKNGWTQ